MKIQDNVKSSTQSRKWLLTLNNPDEKNITFNVVADILKGLRSVDYYCISSEIGEQGTKHFHLFIYSGKSAIRFSTLKKRFEQWHINKCIGTATQCRDYVGKFGKWENSSKHKTNNGDFAEYGTFPIEEGKNQGKRNDVETLISLVESGVDDISLLKFNPKFIRFLPYIDRLRQKFMYEQSKNTCRDVEVFYIYGKTGTGKSRFIFETFKDDAYFVTDYKAGYDLYQGEKILCLEEFQSSYISLRDMLRLTDRYPLQLHARFYNRFACFDKIFILSNIPLDKQYEQEREYDIETYRAFRRRIHHVYEFIGNGEYLDMSNPTIRHKISDLSKKYLER